METLERLFPETPHPLTETTEVSPEDTNQTISVFMLGGDSTVLQYRPDMLVKDLKLFVEQRLGTLREKQRLMYKDKELKVSHRKHRFKYNALFKVFRLKQIHDPSLVFLLVSYCKVGR